MCVGGALDALYAVYNIVCETPSSPMAVVVSFDPCAILIRARTTEVVVIKVMKTLSVLLAFGQCCGRGDYHERLKKRVQQKKLVKKYEKGVKKMLLARRSLIQMFCGYSTLMPGKMYRVLTTSTCRQPSTLSGYTVPPPFFPFAGVPPSPRRYSEWKLTVASLPLVHAGTFNMPTSYQ